jgi:hypothetical protein
MKSSTDMTGIPHSLAFLAYGAGNNENQGELELTYNYGVHQYDHGGFYGHIALGVEDVALTCQKIKEIFAVYPDHLKAIGSHMDFDRSRTVKAKDRALEQLIFMHKQSNICDQGCDHENVDPKELRKELKGIERSLKKQRRVIKRSDTSLENSFYYHYEF